MPSSIRPLTSDDAALVPELRAMARAAESTDGVAPLNEASLLALDALEAARPGSGAARGFLALEADTAVGVAVDADGEGRSIDLVVRPEHRCQGVGHALVDAVLARSPQAGFWAHGDLTGAAALARAAGLRKVRELWVMSRPVAADETFETELPTGFVARPYDGSEAQARAWLEVNAEAFAQHPEQGRMTLQDFRLREAEDWFDPDGLVLVWDERGQTPALAASHWTKREPDSDVGEVYVVAVAPAYQGRGLSRPLTNLGLAHLARRGVHRIELYVEGDNEPAKAAYVRAGFTRASADSMYLHQSVRSEGNTQE